MQKYLVAYTTGAGVMDSAIVSLSNDYSPASDDMHHLRRCVIDAKHPKATHLFADRYSNGSPVEVRYDSEIKADDLIVIAVSKLD